MNKLIIAIIMTLQSGFAIAEQVEVNEILTQAHERGFTGCDSAIKSYFESESTSRRYIYSQQQVTVRPKFIERKNEATGLIKRYLLADPEIQVVVGSHDPGNDSTAFMVVGVQKRDDYCVFRSEAILDSGEVDEGCNIFKTIFKKGTAVGKFYWSDHEDKPDVGNNQACVDIKGSKYTDLTLLFYRGQEIKRFPTDEAKK